MKKFLLLLFFASFIFCSFTIFFNKKQDTKIIENEKTYTDQPTNINNCTDYIHIKIQHELEEINTIDDRKQWFLAYKEILFKYSRWIDIPETVFDIYTETEVLLICRTVETECYDCDFESKCNVASVIFNRIKHEDGNFGNSVEEVIKNKNQFAYWREEISEDTILSVMYAYEIEDTTDGCIAFRSDEMPEFWYDWSYAFTDDSGHHFYK